MTDELKIITEPHVHVLSSPQFFDHPEYELPDGGTPAERLIAHAGKGCYDSYGPDGRAIGEHIGALVSSGHGSVLEHANISLFIAGVSRGLSHELVRHRHFSFSQRSTRYTAEEGAAIVLDPYLSKIYHRKNAPPPANENDMGQAPPDMDEAAVLGNFTLRCEAALQLYAQEVSWLMELNPYSHRGKDLRKWARGIARQILPHALETRLTMTGNIRSWRDFIEQRSSRHAEGEIRRLTRAIVKAIQPIAPLAFQDMQATLQGDYPEYIFTVRKV